MMGEEIEFSFCEDGPKERAVESARKRIADYSKFLLIPFEIESVQADACEYED